MANNSAIKLRNLAKIPGIKELVGDMGIGTLEEIATEIDQLQAENKRLRVDVKRLNWLDLHTAFVADGEYSIGPYKTGELRKMADDGIAIDKAITQALNQQSPANTPPIVCICGSTRFMNAFFEAGWKFTLEGKIVLSVGVCKHAQHHGAEALGQDVADRLDELHLRKIDLADSVFVLNVGGYIGESTAKEIEYAKQHNKPIEYLEALAPDPRQLKTEMEGK